MCRSVMELLATELQFPADTYFHKDTPITPPKCVRCGWRLANDQMLPMKLLRWFVDVKSDLTTMTDWQADRVVSTPERGLASGLRPQRAVQEWCVRKAADPIGQFQQYAVD